MTIAEFGQWKLLVDFDGVFLDRNGYWIPWERRNEFDWEDHLDHKPWGRDGTHHDALRALRALTQTDVSVLKRVHHKLAQV